MLFLLFGPRFASLVMTGSWLALSLWLFWRHRSCGFALPEPFPMAAAAVATSPVGVVLGWWLVRRGELPSVGLTCFAYSGVGALVALVAGLLAP
ncbi:MAG: hypothetical protein JNJ54_16590 [Myxococcaceae bacterium]|nr:hypothetical protein [Myxococcaceae bacterium]